MIPIVFRAEITVKNDTRTENIQSHKFVDAFSKLFFAESYLSMIVHCGCPSRIDYRSLVLRLCQGFSFRFKLRIVNWNTGQSLACQSDHALAHSRCKLFCLGRVEFILNFFE